MKYFLSILSILAFVGAGCAQQTDTKVEVAPVEEDAQAQVQLEVEAEGEAQTDEQANIVTGDVEIQTEPVTEGEVPLTEVTLGEQADVSVNMEIGNYFASPNAITASAGDRVKVTFTKVEGMHTFLILDTDVNFSVVQGESIEFTAPSTPGVYTFFCDIGSHQGFGLEGTLVVK